MPSKQLWYTRREKEIRGPFPAGQITRDILLGRVLQTDELSTDQISWQPVTDLPELIPYELKADLTIFENKERLRIARFREDERQGRDRRHDPPANENKQELKSRGPERRSPEPIDAIRHRELKTHFADNLRNRKPQEHKSTITALVLLLSAVALAAISISIN